MRKNELKFGNKFFFNLLADKVTFDIVVVDIINNILGIRIQVADI